MGKKNNAGKLRARYERLKASIAALGPVQIGTITERIDRRPDAQGRPGERGPYYQWTFKEAGKTRTRNLSQSQAAAWGRAIQNHRKLEAVVMKMRSVSLEILRETTPSAPARKKMG